MGKQSSESIGDATVLSAPEKSDTQHELGRWIYDRAEALRLRALARVGISGAITDGVRHHVELRSARHNLKVELGADSQLNINEGTLREITITERLSRDETFLRGRYIEPDGTMWIMGDGSQGPPWYPGELPVADLAEMLGRLDKLEGSNYYTAVTLSGYQQVADPS